MCRQKLQVILRTLKPIINREVKQDFEIYNRGVQTKGVNMQTYKKLCLGKSLLT